GFLWFYFVNEHFLRYLNKRVPRDYDTVPLWLFWGLMLVWLFPWSAFLPQSLARVPLRLRSLKTLDLRGRATLLFALWALVILLFFSFSTRQEYYVIPAITPQALGMFRAHILMVVAALLLGSAAAYVLRRRARPLASNLTLAMMMVAVLFMVHRGLMAFEPILSSKDLAAAVAQHYRPNDLVVIDGDYEEGSTINFYTGIPVHILNHREGNLWYGSLFPDAPQ